MENDANSCNAPYQDNRSNSSADYLKRAAIAVNAGDKILGVHLYLAAFERAFTENIVPSDAVLEGMGRAWDLAIATKQRSLAEYIFEKMEPFWTADEMMDRAEELQQLAFDKLEEYGFTREAIEDMADMVSQDLMSMGPEVLYHFDESDHDMSGHIEDFVQAPESQAKATDAQNQASEASAEDTEAKAEPAEAHEEPKAQEAKPVRSTSFVIPRPSGASKKKTAQRKEAKGKSTQHAPRFDYRAIVGFDRAIEQMHKLGVGRSHDEEFQAFVRMLNFRHGLARMPQLGTVLFRSESREDANYFMAATVGELGLPAVRMRLDRNASGQPVLFVMASPDFKSRLASLAQAGFESPTVLLLEDFDQWALPTPGEDDDEDMQSLLQAQLSRGAREALSLIHSALESSEVTVLITCEHVDDIDPYFIDLIGSCRVITIDYPTDEERKHIWQAIQKEHPSMRGLPVRRMTEFSRGMSRFELIAAAADAVDEAYRNSLEKQEYCAVNTEDMVRRLANFQPLDSSLYAKMEDFVAESFSKEIDNLDDLLKG